MCTAYVHRRFGGAFVVGTRLDTQMPPLPPNVADVVVVGLAFAYAVCHHIHSFWRAHDNLSRKCRAKYGGDELLPNRKPEDEVAGRYSL